MLLSDHLGANIVIRFYNVIHCLPMQRLISVGVSFIMQSVNDFFFFYFYVTGPAYYIFIMLLTQEVFCVII